MLATRAANPVTPDAGTVGGPAASAGLSCLKDAILAGCPDVSGADPDSLLLSPADSGALSAPSPAGAAAAPAAGMWPALVARFEQHRFLVVFALLASLMGVSVGMAQVATSLYGVSLGSSPALLGLIATAQSVGVLFVGLPVGMLVDRFGPARPFVTGTLLVGLIYTLLPLGTSPASLLVCTALVSFAMPLRFVSLNTLFLEQLASLGEAKAGWYRGTHMLGMFLIGPMLGASLVSWLGFAWTYRLIAGLFFATILVSPVVFGRYGRRPAPPRAMGWQALRSQLALLLRDREVRAITLLESLTQATGGYFTFFIVVVALQVAGLTASEASTLISAKGSTYIVALFLLGGSVKRLGPLRAKLASFACIGLSLAAIGISERPLWLWVGALGLGLGLGTIQIATLTRYAQIGDRTGHGKASGLNALAGPLGWVFGNLAGGVLGNWVGQQTVFSIIAGAFALAVSVLGAELWRERLSRVF
jgi:MFS family permease